MIGFLSADPETNDKSPEDQAPQTNSFHLLVLSQNQMKSINDK